MDWLFFHSHTSFPLGSLENRNPWVHSPLSSDISVKAIAPLTLILFKPLLTLFSYMLWLKPQQIRESPQNHLNVNWTEFVNETKLDTHMLSTKVDNEIRINHMRQKQEKCDSFAWNPSYYEHLFIITSLAITQTVELWMNTGVYPLLSFCIIVGHCFCHMFFQQALLIGPGKTNHLIPNQIKLQSAIVVGPGTCWLPIQLTLNSMASVWSVNIPRAFPILNNVCVLHSPNTFVSCEKTGAMLCWKKAYI